MKSILISEPASPGEVFISERSDQIDYNGGTLTFYRGTFTRIGPPWKSAPSSAVSSMGVLLQRISDTVFHSIEAVFVNSLSTIRGIERILIRKDNDFFRVWVVIGDMDLEIEDQVYAAQLAFMDQFPDIPFDFTMIFRQGKDPASIQPSQARLVYSSP